MKWAAMFIGAVAMVAATSSSIAAEESDYKLVAVKIRVNDSQKAIDFYSHLGLKAGQKYNAAEQELKWEKANSGAQIVLIHDETGRIKMPTGGSYLTFMVADIKATAKKLKEAGAEVGEPMGDGKTYVIMMTRDPDGNRIELVQPVAAQ